MSTIDRGSVVPGQGDRTEAAPVEASGWVMFAAIMLVFIGIWNIFEGVFAFFRSSWFIGSAVFGPLFAWSVVWIVIGVVLVAAGYALIAGQSWARWFGIAIASLAGLVHLMSLATYPLWSIFALTVDFLIVFGLAAHWERRERPQMTG